MEGIDVVSLSGISSGQESLGNTLASFSEQTRETAQQRDQENQQDIKEQPTKFKIDIVASFTTLNDKLSSIKDEIFKFNEAVYDSDESIRELGEQIEKISSLFTKRKDLESTFFNLIYQARSTTTPQPATKPQPTTTQEPSVKPQPIADPWQNSPQPQQKSPEPKAEGGLKPGDSGVSTAKNKILSIRYADTMQLPIKASGMAGISVVGEMLSNIGPLAGLFVPQKSVFTNYAKSFGLSPDEVNTEINVPVSSALSVRDRLKKEFGMTWFKILSDDDFVNQYIDREGDPSDPDSPTGFVPAKWDEDPEFVEKVNDLAQRYNLSAPGLLALMARESGLKPDAENSKSHAVGLIQFMNPGKYGFTVEQMKKMTRAQQMPYVEQYLVDAGMKSGMTAADIYGLVFLPGRMQDRAKGAYGSSERMSTVLTTAGESYYNANTGLDNNSDGKITLQDLQEELKETAKTYKIEGFARGGSVGSNTSMLSPYVVDGPISGFDFTISDGFGREYDTTLHGREIVAPTMSGFKVFPLQNRKYDIEKEPEQVIRRWKQIGSGIDTKKVMGFAAGGSVDFWKLAALVSKEDSLHPQGQADVAQALYNRAAVGAYPGGKSIGAIVTAPGQFEPTFHNTDAWSAIRDRKSAIAAAGNASKVDMAAKSITNPALQKGAQKFVGGRTDFMGESQKPNMKPGDVTRGPGYNFHGWFYDARLPNPAPVPKMVTAKTISVPSGGPKPVYVSVPQSNPTAQFISNISQAVMTIIPFRSVNTSKLKSEHHMKRTK